MLLSPLAPAGSDGTPMLCEGKLWMMAYSALEEEVTSTPPGSLLQSFTCQGTQGAVAAACMVPASPGGSPSTATQGDSPETTEARSSELDPNRVQNPWPLEPCSLKEEAPVVAGGRWSGRSSPGDKIRGHLGSGGDRLFLVPPSCQSICQNYSDLHIRGDQVLPLSSDGTGDSKAATGPFLQSCEVLPAVEEDSLLEKSHRAGPLRLSRRAGSSRWRQGSGRDRSFLIHGQERPFTNSFLNCYLERKLSDLYQQYMLENMARDQAAAPDMLILSSLDHLTLQLSREYHLEAGLAKDMVLSCFLRVTSDMHSGEISTPMLQFSEEPPAPQTEAPGEK
ncbi:hypothetical protein CRUP_009418 [Coryphaenoides rupestris]|nr:hypothetical protein CRUP_009418 [Coryphaenoides rupestris]